MWISQSLGLRSWNISNNEENNWSPFLQWVKIKLRKTTNEIKTEMESFLFFSVHKDCLIYIRYGAITITYIVRLNNGRWVFNTITRLDLSRCITYTHKCVFVGVFILIVFCLVRINGLICRCRAFHYILHWNSVTTLYSKAFILFWVNPWFLVSGRRPSGHPDYPSPPLGEIETTEKSDETVTPPWPPSQASEH